LTEALVTSNAAGTPWENKLSLQSLLNVVSTEGRDFLHKINVPTLYVVFPDDPFTGNADFHRSAYETMGPAAEFKVVQPGPASNITEFQLYAIEAEIEFLRKIAAL
jgi:hypothetical protein